MPTFCCALLFFVCIPLQLLGQISSIPPSPAPESQVAENIYGFSLGGGYARGGNTGGADAGVISCAGQYRITTNEYLELRLSYILTFAQGIMRVSNIPIKSINKSWLGDISYSWRPIPSVESLKLNIGIAILHHSTLESVISLPLGIQEAMYQQYISPGIQAKIVYEIPLQKNISIDLYTQLYSFLPRGNISSIPPGVNIGTQYFLLSIGAAFKVLH